MKSFATEHQPKAISREQSSSPESRHRFTGRHVLVSGGADGVGSEATRLFAAEGARVSIIDIQGQRAAALAEELMEKGCEAIAVTADVSDAAMASLQGRICEPAEVARVALFLASDDASFVNGETVYVDNGAMARA